MATPLNIPKPDLGALRIGEGQRNKTGTGKRVFYAAIPVLIFLGIVLAAFALRSQKPMVEVAAATKAEGSGPQTLLNASGYIAGRIAGVNILRIGSGNIGATNVLRELGKGYGYAVFFADLLKGFVAVRKQAG